MSWWNRPFLPSADLRPGQRVEVIGEGPVTVVNGNPHGSHSSAFTAMREGDDEPVFFSRMELATHPVSRAARAVVSDVIATKPTLAQIVIVAIICAGVTLGYLWLFGF
jgi:hypothetical protein